MPSSIACPALLDLATLEVEQTLRLPDFEHPVTAYLNSLAPASRRPQLKIRGLLEEHYQPATANRMLAALRGVLRECWHAHLMTIEEYQAATNIPPVRGEPEPRGRHLSAGELRALFRACSYVATGEVALSRALASEAGRLRGTWRSAV